MALLFAGVQTLRVSWEMDLKCTAQILNLSLMKTNAKKVHTPAQLIVHYAVTLLDLSRVPVMRDMRVMVSTAKISTSVQLLHTVVLRAYLFAQTRWAHSCALAIWGIAETVVHARITTSVSCCQIVVLARM
jgi:hypothetical protein